MAKLFGGIAISYVLSLIDLVPDFIPVLGYLDDVIIDYEMARVGSNADARREQVPCEY